MKKIGIIGAMQLEIDLLLEKIELRKEYEVAGFPFLTGVIDRKKFKRTIRLGENNEKINR